MRVLITGATGFIGGRLARALRERDVDVRCLVRDREKARDLEELGCELHEGDATDAESLRGAGRDCELAYYLIHGMGQASGKDFETAERDLATNFARTMVDDGVERTVYVGGLGLRPRSRHLRSRHRTAQLLAEHGPPLTYVRAGMVVGAGSESFRTLRFLVQRLPVMIEPAWLRTETQPVAVDDVVEYLVAAPLTPESADREVQVGGPDVLTYSEMIDRMAGALGRRRPPRVPVPLLSPRLSSLWIGLVTPVDAGVAKPLIESLSTATTVTDDRGAKLFDIEPMAFDDALGRALAEERDEEPARLPA